MRLIVAGGSGFIGSALTRTLAKAGFEVVVLSRSARPQDKTGVRFAAWDGESAGDWAGLVDGAFAVVNLAGADIAGRRWSASYKELLRLSRLAPTLALTRAIAAAAHKPKVVIQASAIGYYGDRREPVDEDSPPGQGFLAGLARQWEEAGAEVEALGVRRCLIRTGIVLGTAGGVLARMLPAFRNYAGAVMGSGRQGFSWIHLADEVGAIRFLLENEAASGPFNLCAPGAVDMAGFATALGRALSRPVPWRAPGFFLRALLGEMGRELLLNGVIARPSRLLKAGYRFRFPDLDPALRDLLAPGRQTKGATRS